MHRFHPSRGRILFEVACAMTMAASFAVAWTQTGATALLPAAAVAVLYSVVRTFDLRQRAPAAAAPVPAALPAMEEQADLPAEVAPIEVAAAKDEKPAAKPKPRTRKKAAAPKVAVVVEIPEPPVVDLEVEAPAAVEAVAIVPDSAGGEDDYHPAPVPLFEPEPFVRQQRTVFGRKAG